MKLSIQPTGIMADSSVATARLTIYLYWTDWQQCSSRLESRCLYALLIFPKRLILSIEILFYKLKSNGLIGRVIDTLWSLYTKSHIRVKRNGKLSPVILNQSGVNQGGISSGLLFRRYMADLGNYLNSECGIVISDEILVHLLWADNLRYFLKPNRDYRN